MDEPQQKPSALSDLERKLYSRTDSPQAKERSAPRMRGTVAPRAWENTAQNAAVAAAENLSSTPATSSRLPLLPIFLASLGFFVVAAGIAAFFIFGGANTVSSRNVGIIANGPPQIAAGDTVSLQITVTNKNAVPMELTDLVVEFPEGTRSDTNLETALPRVRESLGTIEPGQSVNRTIRAVLFGEGGAERVMRIVVEYRVASSNAIFHAETEYRTFVGSSPFSLTVEGGGSVVAGEDVPITVRLRSNASAPLKNVLLTAEYPFGFRVSASEPQPIQGETAWMLGDLDPGQEKIVSITGAFSGQDGEERVVRLAAGSADSPDASRLKVAFATSDVSFLLSRPFVNATLSLGDVIADSYVVSRGSAITGKISWVNTLSTPVQDLSIKVAFVGDIINRSSISSRGFFRSSDTAILFTKETDGGFADVAPNDRGVEQFSFSTLPLSNSGSFKNPEFVVRVTVEGRTTDQNSASSPISATFERRVKVSSDLSLSSKAVRSIGVFANPGPLPPKVDTESMYTIIWAPTNSTNAASNVTVTATLPSYVRWVGTVSPQGADISYDKTSRVITWRVGDVSSGVTGEGGQEVMFQVAITPSSSQIGSSPILVNTQKITGSDRFTGSTIGTTRPALTTRITADPGFRDNQADVVE